MRGKKGKSCVPPVWELFLRIICENDKEFQLFFKILENQITILINKVENKENIYDRAISEHLSELEVLQLAGLRYLHQDF